jgi:hypothetical protein
MSKKRRALTTALLVLAALAIGLFAYAVLSDGPIPEPSYKGKPLSEWLAHYRRPERSGGEPTEAELAVRSLGTNALPFLIASLRYELPPWRRALRTLATLGEGKVFYGRSWILGRRARQTANAETGFAILNTNAAPAIPELEVLMKDNRKPDKGVPAIWALGEIGGPAIPALTNALADTNQTNRYVIIDVLYTLEIDSAFYYGNRPTGASVPALSRALNDPDPQLRLQAYHALSGLAGLKLAPWSCTNAPYAQ